MRIVSGFRRGSHAAPHTSFHLSRLAQPMYGTTLGELITAHRAAERMNLFMALRRSLRYRGELNHISTVDDALAEFVNPRVEDQEQP